MTENPLFIGDSVIFLFLACKLNYSVFPDTVSIEFFTVLKTLKNFLYVNHSEQAKGFFNSGSI